MTKTIPLPENKKLGILIEWSGENYFVGEGEDKKQCMRLSLRANGRKFYDCEYHITAPVIATSELYKEYEYLKKNLPIFLEQAARDAIEYAAIEVNSKLNPQWAIEQSRIDVNEIEKRSKKIRKETLTRLDKRKELDPKVNQKIRETIKIFSKKKTLPNMEEFAEEGKLGDGRHFRALLKQRRLNFESIKRFIKIEKSKVGNR